MRAKTQSKRPSQACVMPRILYSLWTKKCSSIPPRWPVTQPTRHLIRHLDTRKFAKPASGTPLEKWQSENDPNKIFSAHRFTADGPRDTSSEGVFQAASQIFPPLTRGTNKLEALDTGTQRASGQAQEAKPRPARLPLPRHSHIKRRRGLWCECLWRTQGSPTELFCTI